MTSTGLLIVFFDVVTIAFGALTWLLVVGPAPWAFLLVPIVGACLIDLVNALVISLGLSTLG